MRQALERLVLASKSTAVMGSPSDPAVQEHAAALQAAEDVLAQAEPELEMPAAYANASVGEAAIAEATYALAREVRALRCHGLLPIRDEVKDVAEAIDGLYQKLDERIP
jgi:hypothetical protein